MYESDYNVVTDPVSGQRLRLITTPHGGVTGTGSVAVEDYANGTLMRQAIDAYTRLVLAAGSGILIDTSVAGVITISATGGGSYTAENARNDIAAALRADASYLVITPDDPGNTITLSIDPAFKARVAALEGARSLVQVKENSGTGGAGNYMSLPGGSGNYVSTPNNAAFNVAGDLTVAVRVKMPASAPAATESFVGRWGASVAAGSFQFNLRTNGQLQVITTVDGVASSQPITTAATPLAFDGNWIWLLMSRKSSDGTVDFYTAPDTGSDNVIPGTWTTFQLNRTTTAGVLYNNGGTLSVPMTVGAVNAGTLNVFTGQIGRVVVYSGNSTASTVVADANAADYTTGTTWVGPASNTWTLNGTATVVLVGGGATANTAAKFVLADTDAFAGIAFAHKDAQYWFGQGGLINTSGSAANFTPELVVNNVVLTTLPAISLPSVANGVYRYEVALTIESSSTDGTTQVYAWTVRIYDAVTALGGGAAPFSGSQLSSLVLKDYGGGFSGALSTFLSIPKIELKMTMGTAASTISAGMTNTRLALQKA